MSVQAERYEGAEPYIFISYSHADSERVLAIVAAMEKRGYRVWYDAGINAGQQWTETLANKIAGCEVFLLFASVSYMASFAPDSMRPFCRLEFLHAQKTRRQMVPVRLDETAFPNELNFLIGNPQQIRPAADETAEAFAAKLDAEPLFQRCRAGTAQTPAPLAKIVTQNRPATPSGAFVGREDKIQAIEDAFRDEQTAVVLYGMGGIGKSEICRKLFWEYAHGARTRLSKHIGWAMWRGTPKETFYGQFRDIREENAEIYWQQARTYLETLGRNLLMFLDNADTLTETDAAELTQLGCRFLITSRKRPGRLFAVPAGTLTPKQCRILYRRALREDDACTDASPDAALDEILRLAAYHTLSVQLLAKTQWATGLASAEMLSQLRESGFDLSGADIAYLHNPEQKQNIEEEAAFIDHMSRVFNLSQLRSDADALRALQGMSLLAPNTPILVRDVKKWLDLPNLNGLNRAVKLGWLNDTLESGVREVSIHPVIAAVVRYKAMPDETLIDTLAGRLYQDMYVGTREVFTTKLPMLEHAMSLDKMANGFRTANYGLMLAQMGFLFFKQADYDKVLFYLERGAKIESEKLGAKHPDTAIAYNNIGRFYDSQGDYDKAMKYFQDALKIREETLGLNHPDTANSYNNVGTIYYFRGDYDNALKWFQGALRIWEKTLGLEHQYAASSYSYIGLVYDSWRDYDNALQYHQKALQIWEKTLGSDHLTTAIAYDNIGSLYRNQEDYDNALRYYQKTLRIREKVLRDDHPNMAHSYHNIGTVYFGQEYYGEALKWLEKALAVRLKVLGEKHPLTKSTQEWIDKTKRRLSGEK